MNPSRPDQLIQPSIQQAGSDGTHAGSLPLPENYELTTDERGPRRNLVLEAITSAAGGRLLERGFSTGSGYNVKLFEMSTVGATDVQNVDSLAGADITPTRKRLLVDFDDLPLPGVDNFEGMAWGPRLPTGERSLLVVSDDNFWPGENNRFVALAID